MMKDKSNLQKKRKRSEMSDFERVQDYQRKVYRKAKQDSEFRFYVLYDKVRLGHFLREAYKRVKKNRGAPGVDGVTFEMIEENGSERFVEEIRVELEKRIYKPQAVKRVMIPKANGKMRPLGIPTIKDRVVQMSCKMVIEPIFEADFEESSYGFRPKRSSSDAIRAIKENLKEDRTEVYDVDLSNYFDTIPHEKLMKLISQRISDKQILHLIKMWLKAPVKEDGQYKGGKKNKIGTPQGGVISPLLANIYLHLVDRIINREGSQFSDFGIKIVRYADDFVLMGKKIPEIVLTKLYRILDRMDLKINEEKSSLLEAKREPFNFLGFTVRYDRDVLGRDKRYWNIFPSEKSCKTLRNRINEFLKKSGHFPPERLTFELNMKLRGWLNYFSIKRVSYPAMSKRKLRWYLSDRINRYYGRKSQRKSKLHNRGAFEILVNQYGLIDPSKY